MNASKDKVPSFKMLLDTLQGIKNDSIFDLDPVKYLIDSSWDEHKTRIFYRVFVPYLVQLVLVHYYFMYLIDSGIRYLSTFEYWLEILLRHILIGICIYFIWNEYKQVQRDRMKYFKSIFNWTYPACLLLQLYLFVGYSYGLTSLRI